MTTRRRIERLELDARLTKAAARRMTDDEVRSALRAAVLQDARPAASIPREELGPPRAALAHLNDDELLGRLRDARAAAGNPWRTRG